MHRERRPTRLLPGEETKKRKRERRRLAAASTRCLGEKKKRTCIYIYMCICLSSSRKISISCRSTWQRHWKRGSSLDRSVFSYPRGGTLEIPRVRTSLEFPPRQSYFLTSRLTQARDTPRAKERETLLNRLGAGGSSVLVGISREGRTSERIRIGGYIRRVAS